MTKLGPMIQNKLSSRVYMIVKSALAAAALPIIFIYIFIAKPDYKLMNAAAHVVVPVAGAVGDLITWPVRLVGDVARGARNMATLQQENEELRAQLDAALAHRAACDIAVAENQKMAQELDMMRNAPHESIMADVIHDNAAFHHNTFWVSKGANSGIEPGMIVISTDGRMAGIIIDAGANFARVRAITDADTNIAVRVVGTEIYGFLRGNGSGNPTMGFFSNPQFQAHQGIKLVTSNISGVLPNGIVVGDMINDTDVDVMRPERLSRVMILKFDENAKYK